MRADVSENLASSIGNLLNDILNMLDELSLSLLRFRAYKETIPMDKDLESVPLDGQPEMIYFNFQGSYCLSGTCNLQDSIDL